MCTHTGNYRNSNWMSEISFSRPLEGNWKVLFSVLERGLFLGYFRMCVASFIGIQGEATYEILIAFDGLWPQPNNKAALGTAILKYITDPWGFKDPLSHGYQLTNKNRFGDHLGSPF